MDIDDETHDLGLIADPSESHGEDSQAVSESIGRGGGKRRPRPLSESLRAAMGDLGGGGKILGPDLFHSANEELYIQRDTRESNACSGMIFAEIDGCMRFLYRDEMSRAWHVFQSINGLTFPSDKTEIERQELRQVFLEGWADGSLFYLAKAPAAQGSEV